MTERRERVFRFLTYFCFLIATLNLIYDLTLLVTQQVNLEKHLPFLYAIVFFAFGLICALINHELSQSNRRHQPPTHRRQGS